MKKYVSLFIFFFVVGTLWGKFFYYSQENRDALFQKPKLKLLIENGFIPDDIIEAYSLEKNILIQITTYKTKDDLVNRLSQKKYDLVVFKSYHANEVITKLSKLTYTEIKNKDSISADFKNPPYDPGNTYAIPLFWGIEKNSTIEKSQLWTDNIGIAGESEFKKEAHSFVDYILQTDVTVEMIRYKKVASTNKAIEKSKNIEYKLKPSYLRKLSIRDLSFKDQAGF